MLHFSQLTYKEINASKFFSRNPTYIGCVLDAKFYEHPVYGDTVPLIVVLDGRVGYSLWEYLPDACELLL